MKFYYLEKKMPNSEPEKTDNNIETGSDVSKSITLEQLMEDFKGMNTSLDLETTTRQKLVECRANIGLITKQMKDGERKILELKKENTIITTKDDTEEPEGGLTAAEWGVMGSQVKSNSIVEGEARQKKLEEQLKMFQNEEKTLKLDLTGNEAKIEAYNARLAALSAENYNSIRSEINSKKSVIETPVLQEEKRFSPVVEEQRIIISASLNPKDKADEIEKENARHDEARKASSEFQSNLYQKSPFYKELVDFERNLELIRSQKKPSKGNESILLAMSKAIEASDNSSLVKSGGKAKKENLEEARKQYSESGNPDDLMKFLHKASEPRGSWTGKKAYAETKSVETFFKSLPKDAKGLLKGNVCNELHVLNAMNETISTLKNKPFSGDKLEKLRKAREGYINGGDETQRQVSLKVFLLAAGETRFRGEYADTRSIKVFYNNLPENTRNEILEPLAGTAESEKGVINDFKSFKRSVTTLKQGGTAGEIVNDLNREIDHKLNSPTQK